MEEVRIAKIVRSRRDCVTCPYSAVCIGVAGFEIGVEARAIDDLRPELWVTLRNGPMRLFRGPSSCPGAKTLLERYRKEMEDKKRRMDERRR